jgi:hypothetical protein
MVIVSGSKIHDSNMARPVPDPAIPWSALRAPDTFLLGHAARVAVVGRHFLVHDITAWLLRLVPHP